MLEVFKGMEKNMSFYQVTFLGVCFDLEDPRSGKIYVSNPESRRVGILQKLEEVFEAGRLCKEETAKLRSFDFC